MMDLQSGVQPDIKTSHWQNLPSLLLCYRFEPRRRLEQLAGAGLEVPGFSMKELRAKLPNGYWTDCICEKDRDLTWKELERGLPPHRPLAQIFSLEYRLQSLQGAWVWVRETGVAYADNGQIYIQSYIEKIEKQGVWLMQHDTLTLPLMSYADRGAFLYDALKTQLKQAMKLAKTRNTLLAIIFLRIKNYDLICNLSGYVQGEQILRQIDERLLDNIRRSDWVLQISENKFCIVLQDIEVEDDSVRVIHQIENIVAEPIHVGSEVLMAKTQVGVSFFPKDSEDEEDLLNKANIALHHNTRSDQLSFHRYEQKVYERLTRENQIEKDLPEAISHQQFQVYYQPVIELSTGRVVGAEALLRWLHPEQGFIPPAEFIPVAERSGHIVAIGALVFEMICQHLRDEFSECEDDFRIAVNVSTHQLNDRNFLPFLQETLKYYQIPTSRICIELTESLFVDNAQAKAKLTAIKKMGCQLSLDDFGTGYSNLGYLSQLDFDHIKIDQSFIRKITSASIDALLVESIITMAHHLNLKIIAEGVEMKEQLELLKEYHCDQIQGYYFSKPLPQEEFKAWLKQWAGRL